MAFSFQPKVVSDGLVLFVDAGNTKSYPGSGTVWADLSSTQITGSLTNGPTFNSANGGSIRFDGTNDYVNLGSSNTLNFTDAFSVSFWTNSNLSVNNYQYFVDRWEYQSGNFRQWSFDNTTTAPVGWSLNTISFRITSAGTDATATRITSSNASYSNQWINVCGIWDKTNIHLYINGISASNPVTASTMVSTPDKNTFIGNTPSFAVGHYPLSGSIAITSIYNRALSATEVLQNYNALKGRFNLT
jgi:hypothetical protein